MTFGHVARLQISWQAQHFVNLEVQISWQAQQFVNLEVNLEVLISWQAQHFVKLEVHPPTNWPTHSHSHSLTLYLSVTHARTHARPPARPHARSPARPHARTAARTHSLHKSGGIHVFFALRSQDRRKSVTVLKAGSTEVLHQGIIFPTLEELECLALKFAAVGPNFAARSGFQSSDGGSDWTRLGN